MLLAVLLAAAVAAAQPAERLADVRVQGNTLTADAEIVSMSGLTVGADVTPDTLEQATARLKATRHFEHVELLKRYASIADPSQILVVIIVDEGRVTVKAGKDGEPSRAVRRRGPPLMYLPILGSEDGYGFTYGALVTAAKVRGPGTRLSVPITWGGERRVGVEFEKRSTAERLMRVRVGGSLLSRRSDAFGATDTRQQLWVRGEREIARPLRIGAWTGVDFVSFGAEDTRVGRLGVSTTLDTRVDPMLARNAVYAHAAVERLDVRGGGAPLRTVLDASGYIGVARASTLVVRVYRDGTNASVPPYLKVLLGRATTLRGYRAGSRAGDSTAAGTLELRVPVSSPMNLAKVGVRAFVDAAAVYDAGDHLADQRFERGIGGGVWLSATVIRLALDVAHGRTGSTRVLVSSGLLF